MYTIPDPEEGYGEQKRDREYVKRKTKRIDDLHRGL